MFRSWMFYNPAQSDARADYRGHLMSCIHIQLHHQKAKANAPGTKHGRYIAA
jgi:hypothetical protein